MNLLQAKLIYHLSSIYLGAPKYSKYSRPSSAMSIAHLAHFVTLKFG